MKVKIRHLEENDAYTSVVWRNIPEIWLHTGSAPDRKITIKDELEWIRKAIADPTSQRFAILADEVYVGNIYLTGISNNKGEYHIFIGEREYWGKGIARKASEEIIRYAKDVLKLKEILLSVKEANVPAVKLYKNLGFKERGFKERGFIQMGLKL